MRLLSFQEGVPTSTGVGPIWDLGDHQHQNRRITDSNQSNNGNNEKCFGLNENRIRQKILCQNFSHLGDKARLISMSRFKPADHNDCILANETVLDSKSQSQSQSSSSQSSSVSNLRNSKLIEDSRNTFAQQLQQPQPTVARGFFLFKYIRDVFGITSMLPKRKFLSAITLLALVSVFCLISSSIVNILISSSTVDTAVNHNHNHNHNGDDGDDDGGHAFKYPFTDGDDGGGGDDPINSIDSAANGLSKSSLQTYLKPIELDEIFHNDLAANYFNGTWINNREIAFYDPEYNLCLLDVEQQLTKHLIRFVQVLTKNLKGLNLSQDKRYLLWPTQEPKEVFRYSRLQKLKIYNIQNQTVQSLFDGDHFHDSYFQLAKWGPKSSQLVFIYDNNLYYKDSMQSETIRLSVTGIPDIIYNGHSDWLYEEEVLNSNQAFWFSPGGEHLAYLQINDTLVDVVGWNHYGDYYNVSTNQYPTLQMVRYPKPGRHNPQVTIYVVNLHSNADMIRMMRIEPPKKVLTIERDFYVSRVVWYDDQRLLIVWTSRSQRRSLLVFCDAIYRWKCQELYDLRSDTGWVDGFEHGLLSASNVDQVIVRVPKLVSKTKGEYYHIATINVKDKSINYLTHGDYDVVKLIHYSPGSNEVFYASTLSNHPEVQHVMKTSLNIKSDPVCMTCYLGNSCRNNEAHFNPLGTYYVLECRGYEIPRVELRSAQTNELIEILDDNQRLYRFLQTKFIPRYEKIYVKLPENYDAIVEFILPHDFDEDRRYPMVIELYGAPGTQMIKDKYEMNHWSSYLTSKHQFIYAKIDCRGTINQGLRHMHQIYKNFGHIEVDDLINVVWFLKTNLTYVDPDRIALWGWSYGGYYSLMAMIRQYDHRLFSCAIAVAPVSNWMYYDSAYSEKYLGVPKDLASLAPYQNSNLIDIISGLRNKKFMLIFGTDDDNVQNQHSLVLMKKLNQLNIDYDLQIYPDDNHYLSRSSSHLYPKMTDYLKNKCFGLNYNNHPNHHHH